MSVLLALLLLFTTVIISAEDAWLSYYHRLGNMLIHNSPAPSLAQSLLGQHHNFSIPEVQIRRGEFDISCSSKMVFVAHALMRPWAERPMRQSIRTIHAAAWTASPLEHTSHCARMCPPCCPLNHVHPLLC